MNKECVGCSATVGKAAYDHDVRNSIAKNVNRELIGTNVVLVDEIGKYKERWIEQNKAKPEGERKAVPSTSKLIYGYIDEKMQPYMDEWNKGKKPCRRFKGTYTEWHKEQRKTSSGNNKKGDLIYEMVLQFGEGETIGKKYYDAVEALKTDRNNPILLAEYKKYRKEFIKVYTKWTHDIEKMGLKVLWATIHFDEGKRIVDGQEINGTPHLHLCVCPITDPERISFQRGPAAQVSMFKTLEAAGIHRKEKRAELTGGKDINLYQLGRFFAKFREIQERDVEELGYTIKERSEHRPHLSQELFIETKRAEKQLENAEKKLEENEIIIQQQEQLVEKAHQEVEQAKELKETYTQEAEEAQEIAKTAQEAAIAAKNEENEAKRKRKAEEAKKEEITSEIAKKEQENQELEAKIIEKQKELDQVIKGIEEMVDNVEEVSKLKDINPKVLKREDKNVWGKKLERPTVTIYEDDFQELKQRAMITPSMQWLADKVKAAIEKFKKLFNIEALIAPFRERAQNAEQEVRTLERSMKELRIERDNYKGFIKDRGLYRAYQLEMDEIMQSRTRHRSR